MQCCTYIDVQRRILLHNFLKFRDGDRFWYERLLSDKVSGKDGLIMIMIGIDIDMLCRRSSLWRRT